MRLRLAVRGPPLGERSSIRTLASVSELEYIIQVLTLLGHEFDKDIAIEVPCKATSGSQHFFVPSDCLGP